MLVFGTGVPNNPYTLNGKMVLMENGNVGIGTANPAQTLDVNGIINATNYLKGGNPVVFSQWTSSGNDVYYTGGNVGINTPTPLAPLQVNGKVIVGATRITSGSHTDFILAVDGKIVSKSTYVTMTGWADDVFDNAYKPLPLEKVEEYYTDKKYLPDYPSEKEIVDNGLDLGNISKLQQKSIEEIMLYLVDMQKEIVKLKEKNVQLEKKIKDLQQIK